MKTKSRRLAAPVTAPNVIAFPTSHRVRPAPAASAAEQALAAALAPIKSALAAALAAHQALELVHHATEGRVIALHAAEHALREGHYALLSVIDGLRTLQPEVRA